MDEHVVIVGAGPAGLAAAWAIRRAGHDPLVVEQADAVAASWRGRHDHLRLNTHRAFSHQPGARIPRRCGPYPARDDYAAYLQEYSAGMRLRLGTRVHRIDRTDEGWVLALDRGGLTAAHVVIATGSDAEPVLPDWPGLDSFGGTVIHAGQFRNVAEMAGRDVLVVGPGNSGVDLLGYLAASDAGRLWLSARSGMTVTPRRRRRAVAPGQPRAAAHAGALAGRHGPRRAAAGVRRPQPVRLSAARARSLHPAARRRRHDRGGRRLRPRAEDRAGGHEAGHRPVRRPSGPLHRRHQLRSAHGHLRDRLPARNRGAGRALVALDRRGTPAFTGAESSPEHPGLWFFGLDSSIYGNMHVRRRQARQLARAITG